MLCYKTFMIIFLSLKCFKGLSSMELDCIITNISVRNGGEGHMSKSSYAMGRGCGKRTCAYDG